MNMCILDLALDFCFSKYIQVNRVLSSTKGRKYDVCDVKLYETYLIYQSE